jgi:hypothetical protein
MLQNIHIIVVPAATALLLFFAPAKEKNAYLPGKKLTLWARNFQQLTPPFFHRK